jgi:hypothetical protein
MYLCKGMPSERIIITKMGPTRNQTEKATGFFGLGTLVLLLLVWIVRIIDQISRVQIMIALAPYFNWLGTWWGQTLELVAAVLFVVWATRLEQDREREEIPRIFLPGGGTVSKPGIRQKAKHQWFWIKLAAYTLVPGVIFIGILGAYWQHKGKSPPQSNPPVQASIFPNAPSQTNTKWPNSLPSVIDTSTPKEKPLKGKANPIAPPVKTPKAPEKPTVAPSQPTQAVLSQPQNQPTNSVPIPANAPLACPAPGTLAQGWKISFQQMMTEMGSNGLPIVNGPISLAVLGPDNLKTILHPALMGHFGPKFGMGGGLFKGSQYDEARAFLDDLGSRVGLPSPLPYRPTEKLDRYVSGVQRKFQNQKALTVTYMDATKGSTEGFQSGMASVPVASLPIKSYAFINKLDATAKTDADQSCRDLLKHLTQDQ